MEHLCRLNLKEDTQNRFIWLKVFQLDPLIFFLERLIFSESNYLSGKTLPQQNFHQVLTTDPRIFDQFGVHANWCKARHGVDFIQ